MKITFVLPHANLSGGVKVVAIYAKHLKERGHEVFVVSTPGPRYSWRQRVSSLLKGKGWLPAIEANHPSHLDQVDVPHHVIKPGQTVTDADVPDADVVIATWWETAEWVARLSASKGAKAYFIQHHEVFDYLPKERVEATYALPLHKITISKWLADLMQTRYGDSDLSLVLNSVDPKQFHAPRRGRQPSPTVGLLYAALPWKGCKYSLEAFAIAAAQIPNLRLVAFGAGPLSAELPLPDQAKYFYRPDQGMIKDIYASCDVWLCGSLCEGFGLPVLEAMACRCPVVSTAVGGPIDLVENGVNGYLTPIGDASALADRLIQVLAQSEAQWQAMSDAAYATATSYSWDEATERFEAALHRAIERQAQRYLLPLTAGQTG